MNELKLKLPDGGFLAIRKVVGEEQDSVMAEISGADAAGASMTASVLAAAVRDAIYTAKWRASHTGEPGIVHGEAT